MGMEETFRKTFTQKQVAWHNKTIKTFIPVVHFYKLVLSGAKEMLGATSQDNKGRV